MGVPLVIHFKMGFSIIKHLFWDTRHIWSSGIAKWSHGDFSQQTWRFQGLARRITSMVAGFTAMGYAHAPNV